MALPALAWLAVATSIAVVLGLTIQVATRTPEGFVARASWTIGGIVVAAAIAALVLWLVGLA